MFIENPCMFRPNLTTFQFHEFPRYIPQEPGLLEHGGSFMGHSTSLVIDPKKYTNSSIVSHVFSKSEVHEFGNSENQVIVGLHIIPITDVIAMVVSR